MFVTVTGGSGSGKSEMAEMISQTLWDGSKVYAATMIAWDEESRKRIERHRKQRAGRHFTTLECPLDLEKVSFKERVPLILLECISNLAANELYSGPDFKIQNPQEVQDRIIRGIRHFEKNADHLVIVTNEMFQNGTINEEMRIYLEITAHINQYLMKASDVFVESVFGLPYFWKKDHRLRVEKGIWVC